MPARSGAAATSPEAKSALASRAEDDAAVGQRRVVQRAHAEAVAHQRQRARRGSHQRERELAVEAVQRGEPVALEQAQHDLGVARRAEALALRLELGAQLGVVVDLAVVDDHACRGRALHRLPAAGMSKIASRVETRPAPAPGASPKPSGPRWRIAPRHPAQRRLLDRARRVGAHDAGDAAHVSGRPGGSSRRVDDRARRAGSASPCARGGDLA